MKEKKQSDANSSGADVNKAKAGKTSKPTEDTRREASEQTTHRGRQVDPQRIQGEKPVNTQRMGEDKKTHMRYKERSQ